LLKMEACDDSYSFICGLSPENAADHTVESLDFARTMIEVAAATDTGLRVRAGVHTIRRMLGGLIRTLCPSDEVEEARHAAVRGVYGCIHLTQEARESYERQKAPLCDNPPPTSVADEGIRATEDIEQADISVEGSIKPPRAVGNRSLDCITIGDPQTTVGDAVRTDHKAPIGSFRWRPVKNTTAVPAGISHSGRKMQADHARDEREENDVAELRARVQQLEGENSILRESIKITTQMTYWQTLSIEGDPSLRPGLNDVEAATPPAAIELGEVQRGMNSSVPTEGHGSGACLSASGAPGLKWKWLEVEKELRARQALRTPKEGSEAKKLVGDFLVCMEEACEVCDDVASRESPQSRHSVAKREASSLDKWSDSGKTQNALSRLSVRPS
ncbi:hypothetical protein FOZ63_026807, partial [Perkinsus olseni]